MSVVKKDTKGERVREFLGEAEDVLSSMGKCLLKLGKGVRAGIIDPQLLNSVFRSAHTLKGISGLCDYREMADLTHALEDALEGLRLGRLKFSEEILNSIISAHALLLRMCSSKGKGEFFEETEPLKAALSSGACHKRPSVHCDIDDGLLDSLTAYEAHRLRENLREGKFVFIVNAAFPLTSFEKSYSAFTELLRRDAEIIATLPSCNTPKTAPPDSMIFDMIAASCMKGEHISMALGKFCGASIRPVACGRRAGRGGADAGKTPCAFARSGPVASTLRSAGSTVRVNIKKLDNIMGIANEIGGLKSALLRMSAELKRDRRLSALAAELSSFESAFDKKVSELKASVLGARMVPIGHFFSRFEPFMEKVAFESGKRIRMTTNGDSTEIDKLIVEELADPLMHIVRNVIDHAIEPPSERRAAGKDAVGTVALSAWHKGGFVIVEVKDDGRGIDADGLLKKAVQGGHVAPGDAKSLSRQEILDLIFVPGLSTLDRAGRTSGRGVGMDVVKGNITRLSGNVAVDSVRGKGTRFLLTIPTTLAVMPVAVVKAGKERFAIPSSHVFDTIELDDSQIAEAAEHGVVTVGRARMPALRLSEFFHCGNGGCAEPRYAVIAGAVSAGRFCMMVDGVIEETDAVIKPLPQVLKPFNIHAVAGAADMGEKGMILVLDAPAIMELAAKEKDWYSAL